MENRKALHAVMQEVGHVLSVDWLLRADSAMVDAELKYYRSLLEDKYPHIPVCTMTANDGSSYLGIEYRKQEGFERFARLRFGDISDLTYVEGDFIVQDRFGMLHLIDGEVIE